MAEVEVVSRGVVTLERVLDLTRVPEDVQLAKLRTEEEKWETGESWGEETRLSDIQAAIGKLAEQSAQRHERLSATQPFYMPAELVAVRGIQSSRFRVHEIRRYSHSRGQRWDPPAKQWVPLPTRISTQRVATGYQDSYELWRLERAGALQAISCGRGYFWERELLRLQEALGVLDTDVRKSWGNVVGKGRPSLETLQKVGLDDRTVFFIDPRPGPFRIDPRSRQNNGVYYVKPPKKYPRPLDLVWQFSYQAGTQLLPQDAIPPVLEDATFMQQNRRGTKPKTVHADQGNLGF